jgi:hypothetical protein
MESTRQLHGLPRHLMLSSCQCWILQGCRRKSSGISAAVLQEKCRLGAMPDSQKTRIQGRRDGKRVITSVSEACTSKTCSRCGTITIKQNLGGAGAFRCSASHLLLDRNIQWRSGISSGLCLIEPCRALERQRFTLVYRLIHSAIHPSIHGSNLNNRIYAQAPVRTCWPTPSAGHRQISCTQSDTRSVQFLE